MVQPGPSNLAPVNFVFSVRGGGKSWFCENAAETVGVHCSVFHLLEYLPTGDGGGDGEPQKFHMLREFVRRIDRILLKAGVHNANGSGKAQHVIFEGGEELYLALMQKKDDEEDREKDEANGGEGGEKKGGFAYGIACMILEQVQRLGFEAASAGKNGSLRLFFPLAEDITQND